MSTALTTQRVQIPFPEDVLRWLVKNQTKIVNKGIISIFRGERKTDHLVEAVLH